MPQIIVTAGASAEAQEATVMLRERITAADFESDRFGANLLERLGWAVEDATVAECREPVTEARREPVTEALREPINEADTEALAPEAAETEACYAWDPAPVQV